MKPVSFDRFAQALHRYQNQKQLLTTADSLTQAQIDKLHGGSYKTKEEELPKGVDKLTLEQISTALNDSSQEGLTALEVGRAVGVSRSTARRYLEYLVSIDQAEAYLKYGEVGRPERKYKP